MQLTKNKTESEKGVLAIILLDVFYGILPLIPRFLNTSLELFQQVYLRLAFGLVFLLLFFHRQIDFKKIIHLPRREWLIVAIRAIIYYFFGVILYTESLLLTKISDVAFISAIPMTAILGFLILREKLTTKKLLLVLLSFLGAVSLSVHDFSHALIFNLGVLVVLISTFFTSLGWISRKWQSNLLNDREIATLMLFFASIFIFVGSLIKGEGLPLHNWSLGILLALMLGGLLNAGVSFLMNYGLARIEAVLANNLFAIDPVFATFFALLVYKEFPVGKEIFGGILIIISALLMNRLEARKKA